MAAYTAEQILTHSDPIMGYVSLYREFRYGKPDPWIRTVAKSKVTQKDAAKGRRFSFHRDEVSDESVQFLVDAWKRNGVKFKHYRPSE